MQMSDKMNALFVEAQQESIGKEPSKVLINGS